MSRITDISFFADLKILVSIDTHDCKGYNELVDWLKDASCEVTIDSSTAEESIDPVYVVDTGSRDTSTVEDC